MFLVEQTRAAVHLLWLRLSLPRKFAARPLDALLAELTPEWRAPARSLSFAALERHLDRAESLAERIPRLPRTCLYRCLARYSVFRHYGFPAELVIALSPRGPDEDGHAWLEFDGVPYRESRASEFVVSFRYPSSASASEV